MGSAGRMALLVAFMVSVASADYYSDGCKEIVCKEVGAELRHPNPRDECSFCCCFHERDLNRHAEYRVCPGNGRYDRTLKKCVPSDFCPHPNPYPTTCEEIRCPANGKSERIPDPSDECSFCCCFNGTYSKKLPCPKKHEYDPVSRKCVPSTRCPADPTTTTTTTTTEPPPPPRDDCRDVYCPECYEGMDYHVENPFDSCSYCDCSESGPVKKHCPYGEEFDNATQTCVPSSRCGSTTPPPDGKDGCHLVQHNCPIPEHMEYTTLYANPWDPHSYCACDWGRVHMMPCAPGTLKFDDVLKTCV